MMPPAPKEKHDGTELPECTTAFIRQVIAKMGYNRRARQDVQSELTAHFEDELRGCTDPQERDRQAQRLIEDFGDVKLLAALCRRAKKRCRPLWAKTMVRMAYAAAVCLVLFDLYVHWFFGGQPNIRVDYLAVLNQMSRPEVRAQDNAWPDYQRAISLLVEPNEELAVVSGFKILSAAPHDFASLPREQQGAVAAWVEANRSAWEQFRTASTKPYCCRPYEPNNGPEPPWLMSLLLPHLVPLGKVASTGIWRSRMELQQGQTGEALEDCLAVARAGRHWQQSGLLVEQLVGVRLSRIAHEEVLRIIGRRSLPAVELTELQRRLAGLYPGTYPLIDLEAERISFLDTVQRVFTEGGPGGGHVIPDRVFSLSADGEPLNRASVIRRRAAALLHAGREQTVAKAGEIFDLAKKLARLAPYEKRDRKLTTVEEMLSSLSTYKYAFILILTPATDRAAELAFQGRAFHEATLTILALQRYRTEKGTFPADLEELKGAGYLEALPADPYADGSLRYRTVGDDFVLYSVGPDFRDNGGRPGTMRPGRSTIWLDDGDVLFWPVPAAPGVAQE